MTRKSDPVDVKVAIQNARDYFAKLFPEKSNGVELEEVELTPDKKYWTVTLSFPKSDLNIFGQMIPNPRREYKEITIESSSGAPIAAKIKVPSGV